ncbi:hypothetical protein PIB30_035267 [Stylosanthes scabra]|uniref:Aminotransferase-like plant mobile domain-containing protein n=1 Tax=Stylosanthes scabra TaxID=79078 RepID=A0ABU6WB32_9FABA|nr:hypothetical protein [Stylosanthes scabra]
MKIVEELGFGAFKHLPLYYLKHQVLKQIFLRFEPYDHTIHAIAGDIKITTEKIGKALGLKYTGSTYPERVVSKDLNDDDYAVFKYFQGISQAALKRLIFSTPVDTDENRDLFKRAFILYIQKCFLLRTSAANISPRALPTIFNLENTKHQNWALHIHNFLLEEVQKAKDNNIASVSGYYFVLMIIYFHETHFRKNSGEAKAQPPWIQYWTGKTLWERMVQEKTMRATAKAPLTNKGKHKKNTRNGSSSESEYISSDSVYEEGYDSDSEMTRSEAMVRVERKSKRKNNSVPAPVQDPESDSDDQETIGHAMVRRKRMNLEGHRIQSRRTRKRGNSPTHSNAESANQYLHDNEEPHQPSEEEGTQLQPPPTQPQPHQPPQEKVPQKQQQQQPQGEIINISSGSEPEPEPTREPEPIPLRVLVPKVEADLEASPKELLLTDTFLRLRGTTSSQVKKDDNGPALHQEEEEEPQQQQAKKRKKKNNNNNNSNNNSNHKKRNSLHNLLLKPIPATQDVIEINSDDEDPEPRPIKMLIPKVEKCVASSLASMLITYVLMSMAEDAAIEPHFEEESQPDPSMPSFSLNLDNSTPQVDEQPPLKALMSKLVQMHLH